MHTRTTLIQVLTCSLLVVACQTSSRHHYPAPPSASYRTESLVLTIGDTSQSIRGAFITQEFIKATREQPLLGRQFIDDDHQRGYQQLAVLSYELWQQKFGADPAVIGTSLVVNGTAHTVVGVMPEEFNIPEGAAIWLPEAASGR